MHMFDTNPLIKSSSNPTPETIPKMRTHWHQRQRPIAIKFVTKHYQREQTHNNNRDSPAKHRKDTFNYDGMNLSNILHTYETSWILELSMYADWIKWITEHKGKWIWAQ